MENMRKLNIEIPSNLTVVQRAELTPDSKSALAAAIAPTLEHIVAAAGIKLTPEQIEDMQQAFIERGTITISPGLNEAGNSLNVEVNTLTWNSLTSPVELPPVEIPQVEALRRRRVNR